MLLEEAPFETRWTMSEEQPTKKKLAKETKVKNITFVSVPDSGKTDSVTLFTTQLKIKHSTYTV